MGGNRHRTPGPECGQHLAAGDAGDLRYGDTTFFVHPSECELTGLGLRGPNWLERQNDEIADLLAERYERAARLRKRIVEIAVEEWKDWNGADGALHEQTSRKGRKKVKTYFNNIGVTPSSSDLRDGKWHEKNPWSSAFISWVMRQAGAASDFRYAQKHVTYIHQAKKNRKDRWGSLFKAYPAMGPDAIKPQVGDLLCNPRSGNEVTYDTIKSWGYSNADIVTERTDTEIVVIGGNVGGKVAKKTVLLDGGGYVQQAKIKLQNGEWSRDVLRYFAIVTIEAEGRDFRIN